MIRHFGIQSRRPAPSGERIQAGSPRAHYTQRDSFSDGSTEYFFPQNDRETRAVIFALSVAGPLLVCAVVLLCMGFRT